MNEKKRKKQNRTNKQTFIIKERKKERVMVK